mgnify:CR=1 FL=1
MRWFRLKQNFIMNRNIELVEKSLDTINPKWEVFLIASAGKNGLEYDTFSRVFDDSDEQMVSLLAFVHTVTAKDLENFMSK